MQRDRFRAERMSWVRLRIGGGFKARLPLAFEGWDGVEKGSDLLFACSLITMRIICFEIRFDGHKDHIFALVRPDYKSLVLFVTTNPEVFLYNVCHACSDFTPCPKSDRFDQKRLRKVDQGVSRVQRCA